MKRYFGYAVIGGLLRGVLLRGGLLCGGLLRCVLLAGVSLVGATNSPVNAQTTDVPNESPKSLSQEAAKSADTDARARLLDSGNSTVTIEQLQPVAVPSAKDFTWGKLTANSPSAGDVPSIGADSGQSFYSFPDGQPYPYFVAGIRGEAK